jgi:hypothetical protein
MLNGVTEVGKLYDVDALKKIVKDTIMYHRDMIYEDDDGQYSIVLDIISSGKVGRPAAYEIADYFGMDVSSYTDGDDEKLWYDISVVQDKIATELNELAGLDGRFYFGSISDSEDFGLMYVWWEKVKKK